MSELLSALLDSPQADRRLPLRTRSLDDPTVALLDAWSSMAAVVDFYQQRIAPEGYLSTATEPGSVLALAGLLGVRPRPGLSASAWLAYQLLPDPSDPAVVLVAGLLSQSVPGPGELPQTFETETDLSARSSWNVLRPNTSLPLADPNQGEQVTELVVAGAANLVSPNDLMLLTFGAGDPIVLQATAVVTDTGPDRTTMTVQRRAVVTDPPVLAPDGAATVNDDGAAPLGSALAGPGRSGDLTDMLSGLLGGLERRPSPLPPTVPSRTNAQIFSPVSDVTPRLLAALRPATADDLYSALGTSVTRQDALPSLSALRVAAAPFGAQAAPMVTLDQTGQVVSTQDWPLGGEHTIAVSLSADTVQAMLRTRSTVDPTADSIRDHVVSLFSRMTGNDEERAARNAPTADVSITMPGASADRTVALSGDGNGNGNGNGHVSVQFDAMGTLTLSAASASQVTVDYSQPPAPMTPFQLTLDVDSSAGTVTFSSTPVPAAAGAAAAAPTPLVWNPRTTPTLSGALGPHRLTVTSTAADPDAASSRTLTLRVSTSLGLTDRKLLDLDGRYDGIVPGTKVVITQAPISSDVPAPDDQVATVVAVDQVSVSRYRITGKVTRLTLDQEWIGEDAVSLADARRVTIHAQTTPLTVLPLVDATPVTGSTILLDSLHAGLESGRTLIVWGTRIDIPDATVPGAEVVVVSDVDIVADAAVAGDVPRTQITLAKPMAYTYRRDTVQIAGNVVRAHQGATQNEVLGSGDPTIAHQQFTLAVGPTLADATDRGTVSSLRVWVDGLRYVEVSRIDRSTPPSSYTTDTDASGRTRVTFAAPLPAGNGNVVASYRSGVGSQGNVRSHQITQLLSRPVSVSGVDNPLAASDGADADTSDSLRARAAAGLDALGGLVSVSDYADLARTLSGTDKAVAFEVSDGRRRVVHVTVSGPTTQELEPDGDLITALSGQLNTAAPDVVVVVSPAQLLMVVLRADVVYAADRTWVSVSDGVRRALLEVLAYRNRELGEDIVLSELVAAAHTVPGVLSFDVTGLSLVSSATDPAQLLDLEHSLSDPPSTRITLDDGSGSGSASALVPAQIAYLSDAVTDTLILTGRTP